MFVLMGGTIDSFYDGRIDTVRPHERSAVPNFIDSLRLYTPCRYVEVAMKDSRDLTDDDLNAMLRVIEEAPERKIIITHGTYTMPRSARFLHDHLNRRNIRVAFTGSLVPLTGFSPSDAPFNLGFAFAVVQSMPPSIYVCMNGRIFTAAEVEKVNGDGVFRPVHDAV